MEKIGNYITDDNGHQHKIKGYDAKYGVYIIIEDHIDQGQTRAIMGYDAKKKSFVLILHNLEQGTIKAIEAFDPWSPLIYEDWECMS